MNRFIFAVVLSVSASSFADLLCRAHTQMGDAEIQIADHFVRVSGAALSQPVVFHHLQNSYDGHETAMITAPGFSISYQNWYGCIHNAVVTTNFRDGIGFIETVQIGQCSGGSTSDEICHVN